MSTILYKGDKSLVQVDRILNCRTNIDSCGGIEFEVLFINGFREWLDLSNITPDIVKIYLDENPKCIEDWEVAMVAAKRMDKKDMGKGSGTEVFDASSHDDRCKKIWANTWFVRSLEFMLMHDDYSENQDYNETKTAGNFNEFNVLILDGQNYNTTKHLLDRFGRDNDPFGFIDFIDIPNPFSVRELREALLAPENQEVIESATVHCETVGDFLKKRISDYDDGDDGDGKKSTKAMRRRRLPYKHSYSGVWLDYTGTLSGNKQKNSYPLQDIDTLLDNEFIQEGGIFAITVSHRDKNLKSWGIHKAIQARLEGMRPVEAGKKTLAKTGKPYRYRYMCKSIDGETVIDESWSCLWGEVGKGNRSDNVYPCTSCDEMSVMSKSKKSEDDRCVGKQLTGLIYPEAMMMFVFQVARHPDFKFKSRKELELVKSKLEREMNPKFLQVRKDLIRAQKTMYMSKRLSRHIDVLKRNIINRSRADKTTKANNKNNGDALYDETYVESRAKSAIELDQRARGELERAFAAYDKYAASPQDDQ